MKTFLCPVNSDFDGSNGGCDLAFFTVDEGLVYTLKKYKSEMVRANEKFPELVQWSLKNMAASFISVSTAENLFGDQLVEQVRDAEEDVLSVVLPPGPVESVASAAVIITLRGFWWECAPKHSTGVVGTPFFYFDWLDQCVNCGGKKEEHAKGKCLFATTRYRAAAAEEKK